MKEYIYDQTGTLVDIIQLPDPQPRAARQIPNSDELLVGQYIKLAGWFAAVSCPPIVEAAIKRLQEKEAERVRESLRAKLETGHGSDCSEETKRKVK